MNNFRLKELFGNNELESYVSNVRVGENKLGKVLYFETDLKYVDVDFSSTFDWSGKKSERPFISWSNK